MQNQGPMLCAVENEKIMQLDYAGRPVKQMGVVTSQYEEAIKLISGYKEKLIEAGILKKEKTPQELHDEQMAMMQSLLNKVNSLEEKVNKYEHREDDTDSKSDVA